MKDIEWILELREEVQYFRAQARESFSQRDKGYSPKYSHGQGIAYSLAADHLEQMLQIEKGDGA